MLATNIYTYPDTSPRLSGKLITKHFLYINQPNVSNSRNGARLSTNYIT